MITADVAETLRQRFGELILDVVHFRDETTVLVPRESVPEVCRSLHDDQGFTLMADLTAVDWHPRDPRFDVVYHLLNMTNYSRLRVKTQLNEGQTVPTVTGIWNAAHWAEREVFDLFGVVFEGHPNLQRLLLPEGWIGYPLRKDYPQTQITLPRPRADKIED